MQSCCRIARPAAQIDICRSLFPLQVNCGAKVLMACDGQWITLSISGLAIWRTHQAYFTQYFCEKPGISTHLAMLASGHRCVTRATHSSLECAKPACS